jgi:carotenoid cleavage dioxygenase
MNAPQPQPQSQPQPQPQPQPLLHPGGGRRTFLAQALSVGASTGVAGAFGWSTSAQAAACAEPATAFATAAAGNAPWTAAYAGISSDVEPVTVRFEGRLPPGFRGSLYRNGAARNAFAGLRYAHWFDGDGAVQRYEIGARGDTLTHSARLVRTDKFVAESAAGRPLRASYGTHVPGAEGVRGPDAINVGNTHVVSHGGRLLALWEGGSAHEIDPRTLATRGIVRWADELAGMPFSAHPRIEPDGTMWNFGASPLPGLLTLYRIGRDGKLQQHHTLRVPDLPMLHDFAVTERHLVFLLPPYTLDRERLQDGSTMHEAYVWRPELGLRAMVLDKAQLDAPPRWFTLPAGFVFHIGNACEDGGVIRLDCMRSASAWQVQRGMMDVMCGAYEPQDHTQAMKVVLDLASGRARQEVLAQAAEFPRVDPRHIGRPYRQVFAALREGAAARPGYDAVMRMDLQRGTIDRYRYGDDHLVEEHIFLPRAGGAEVEGWLVGSAIDLTRRQMRFSVFDAQHLSAGPIAQARLPRLMPAGLHASFVAA